MAASLQKSGQILPILRLLAPVINDSSPSSHACLRPRSTEFPLNVAVAASKNPRLFRPETQCKRLRSEISTYIIVSARVEFDIGFER